MALTNFYLTRVLDITTNVNEEVGCHCVNLNDRPSRIVSYACYYCPNGRLD